MRYLLLKLSAILIAAIYVTLIPLQLDQSTIGGQDVTRFEQSVGDGFSISAPTYYCFYGAIQQTTSPCNSFTNSQRWSWGCFQGAFDTYRGGNAVTRSLIASYTKRFSKKSIQPPKFDILFPFHYYS